MTVVPEYFDEIPQGTNNNYANPNLSLEAMLNAAAQRYVPPPQPRTDGIAAPELPPSMAMKHQSVDEIVKSMNKMPFFMTELDETNDDGEENEALEALKALAYEGEPQEIALNFKNQGNEQFKMKRYSDAREFYTKALNVKSGDTAIETACLNNRAQCNLEMKNYRKCITDCRTSLKTNPKAEKPWFRATKALLALDQLDEARECVINALALNPDNKQVRELALGVKKRAEYLQRVERERREREVKKGNQERSLLVALKARGILSRKTSQPPDIPEEAQMRLEKPLQPESALLFPVVFLYHFAGESDFITAFSEHDSLEEQLGGQVLTERPPWDNAGDYEYEKVEAYMETKTGGLVKVGRKVPLREVLTGGKVEIVDGLVKILVVPAKMRSKFIEEWKTRMGK